MKKIFLYTTIIIISFILFVFLTTRETEEDRVIKERYDNASAEEQRCVHVLNNGSYAHKSLTWKLDQCGVPK